MKNYKVSVNGKSYDVTVEEVSGEMQSQPVAKTTAPEQAVKSEPAPKIESVPKAEPVKSQTAGNKIESPMPGVITAIKVKVGDTIKENTVVVVLEAMKMENDIVSPFAGTVVSVNVAVGSSIEAGDALIVVG